jgi:hypothetical protein
MAIVIRHDWRTYHTRYIMSHSAFFTFVLMSFRRYLPFDVLSFRLFFTIRRFWRRPFVPFEVLSVDVFYRRRFLLRHFVGEPS